LPSVAGVTPVLPGVGLACYENDMSIRSFDVGELPLRL
jgi:hypothetical protein